MWIPNSGFNFRIERDLNANEREAGRTLCDNARDIEDKGEIIEMTIETERVRGSSRVKLVEGVEQRELGRGIKCMRDKKGAKRDK